MSDPVSNTDIEDVLSSIRRLVSTAQEAEHRDRQDATAGDRLVLSPALRVDRTAAEAKHAEPAPHDAAPHERPGSDLLSPRIPMDEPGTDVDEAKAPHDTASQHELQDAQTEDPDPEPQDTPDPEPTAEADQAPADHISAPGTLGQQAANFETMVAARDDQWEPDDAEDPQQSDDSRQSAEDAAEPIDWQDAAMHADDAPESQDPDDAEADEAASRRFEDVWAADRDADQATGNRSGSDMDAFGFEDAVLDEDALRDLVADIVRQELQGALGERITRNVRKLVRREIHRALTSQDFD